jgi:hypothetical protein
MKGKKKSKKKNKGEEMTNVKVQSSNQAQAMSKQTFKELTSFPICLLIAGRILKFGIPLAFEL